MLQQVESLSRDSHPISIPADDMAVDLIADRARINFEKIQQFDLRDVIQRYAKDHDLDVATAQEHCVELKKFLAVCAAAPRGASVGMAGPIDEAWHTFVIFTRKYAVFCKAMGADFIHHSPDTSEDDHVASASGYLRFLDIYEIAFDEPAPGHLWPAREIIIRADQGGDLGATGCAGCGFGPSPAGCASCSACKGQDNT